MVAKNSLTLSIVIPVYNEEDYLAECLDAIAKQTVAPDEVIVVDNNSTDRSRAIAQAYPFVRLLFEKNQGVVHARSRGFDNASSELIGRIDADTILPIDWIENVKTFYKKSNNTKTAITGGAVFRNLPLPRLTSWLQKQLAFRLDRLALGHHMLWGSNAVLPSSLWQRVRLDVCMRTDIHEDIDLAIHLHQAQYPIFYVPSLNVNAVLKRILTDKKALFPDLLRWPRTYRQHHKPGWLLILVAVVIVYILAIGARLLSRLQRLFNIG